MKKFKPFTKAVSFVLSLLIIFYAIPCTIFADFIKTSSNGEAEASNSQTGAVSPTAEVYEVTELREENVKTFRLSDGSFVAAQYPTAVHRKDSEGKW